ncbi:hypothetical protein [Glycomyces tarimensis]
MTVPPNYSVPSDRPPVPGYGFQPQYGVPSSPEEPRPRNYALIGAIIVGCTVLTLGTTLLIALGLTRDEQKEDVGPVVAAETSSTAEETASPGGDENTSPDAEETSAEPTVDEEVGRCMVYDPEVVGDGLELLDSCGDAEAFWKVTNMSFDVSATVDDEGNLTDNQVAYDLCGADYGISHLGEPWTNWHWVYSEGTVDSLYCIEAIGNPDADGRVPYTPGDGDCFDDSSEWWTVPCDSDLALYEVVDTVEFDEPKELSDDEAAAEATCGGEYYWEVTDTEGRTSAIICGNEL